MSSTGLSLQSQGTLTQEAVLEKLQGLLKDLLKLENTALLTPRTRLNEDLNIDSLGMVDLVIFVEEAFSVKFRSANFAKVKTLGDVADLILERSRPASVQGGDSHGSKLQGYANAG